MGGGADVILHSHHYNSRIQSTIEGASGVDGKSILRSAAEAVFADLAVTDGAAAAARYSDLGYGVLAPESDGCVEATSSSFVEGWNAGFPARTEPVCTLTEGFLAGAHRAVTGEAVAYREVTCRVTGAARCRFERVAGDPIAPLTKHPFEPRGAPPDENAITSAVAAMPIHGGGEGLIPMFGVYLARIPADFYNLACIRFVEEMRAKGLGRNAVRLLVADAETAAINTFRAITASPEWARLAMRESSDKLHCIVAMSNALGWGSWDVTSHHPGEALQLESRRGYEARGYRELRGLATEPRCFMLRGAAAGIMDLMYGTGTVAERLGTFTAVETECIARGDAHCTFEVRRG